LSQNSFVLVTSNSEEKISLTKSFESTIPYLYGTDELVVQKAKQFFQSSKGLIPVVELHIHKKKVGDLYG
ncbi:MAG: hypothetical protein ACMXYA_00385, partial [Candidatus Woesearchaeota archaeon]